MADELDELDLDELDEDENSDSVSNVRIDQLPILLKENPSKIQVEMLNNILFVITFTLANNLSYVAMQDLLKQYNRSSLAGLETTRKIHNFLSQHSAPVNHYYICNGKGCDGFYKEGNVPQQCEKCGGSLIKECCM